MIRRHKFISALVALVVVGLLPLIFETPQAIKRMRTLDTLGQLGVIINSGLNLNQQNASNYAVQKITLEQGSKNPVRNGRVLDFWGNPITIRFEQEGTNIVVVLESAGRDGLRSTSDDLSAKFYFQ